MYIYIYIYRERAPSCRPARARPPARTCCFHIVIYVDVFSSFFYAVAFLVFLLCCSCCFVFIVVN